MCCIWFCVAHDDLIDKNLNFIIFYFYKQKISSVAGINRSQDRDSSKLILNVNSINARDEIFQHVGNFHLFFDNLEKHLLTISEKRWPLYIRLLPFYRKFLSKKIFIETPSNSFPLNALNSRHVRM